MRNGPCSYLLWMLGYHVPGEDFGKVDSQSVLGAVLEGPANVEVLTGSSTVVCDGEAV